MLNGCDPSTKDGGRKEGLTHGVGSFDVTVESGAFAARDALAQILTTLERADLDVEEAGTVQLVLAEVLNNILEHAYPSAGPTGSIHVACRQAENGLNFRITDQGRAMPDGQTPLGMPQSVDVDLMDLPEGGFGWFLIHSLAKDVVYERVGQSNQLCLRIAVGLDRVGQRA